MDEDIETQVNKYWGKTAYDGKNIDVTKYMTQLREKYGDTLIEYEELYSDVRLLSPKQIKEIYDYAYQTGLYKDYNPVQEYYRREVLKFLLNTEKNKTIIDMGCEDGRISQGLALFGKNKVYGIDMNEYAIEIAEQNKHDYPKTIKMIEYKKADYTSQDFHDFINKELPEKADTVLFVQPTKEWFTARYRINELLKPEGKAIITMMHFIMNHDQELEKISIENDWGQFASKAKLSYKIKEYAPFYKNKAILIGEMWK